MKVYRIDEPVSDIISYSPSKWVDYVFNYVIRMASLFLSYQKKCRRRIEKTLPVPEYRHSWWRQIASLSPPSAISKKGKREYAIKLFGIPKIAAILSLLLLSAAVIWEEVEQMCEASSQARVREGLIDRELFYPGDLFYHPPTPSPLPKGILPGRKKKW